MKLKLQGITPFSATITPPPSKSQTMRALVFALLAKGESTILNPLISPDTLAMVKAIQTLGAKVALHKEKNQNNYINKISVIGTNSRLKAYSKTIDAQNSGLILRLIGALLGLLPTTTLTGDASVQKNRIVAPLILGLRTLGATVESFNHYHNQERPPLKIKGPIKPGKITIDGTDSQPVSAFLIALSFLKGPSEIFVENANEKPWIDLTLSWLDFLKISYERKGDTYSHFKLFGNAQIKGFNYTVPADFSSLSYPLALAFLTKSHLKIKGLNFQDQQGDKVFISMLKKMGADLVIDKKRGFLEIKKTSISKTSSPLKTLKIDAGSMIDMVPLLAVISTFAKGQTTHIYNASSSRFKESDRLKAICSELKKMGAKIEEKPDGLIIYPSVLKGAELVSYQDHRIALALTVAALSIPSVSTLKGVECIAKTYPNFVDKLKQLKQKIKSKNL